MPKIYDDWEKLVEAVLRREELRRIALDSSRGSSFNSSVSSSLSFGASSSGHDPDFDRFLPSDHHRHNVISKSRTTAGYEFKKDLHDSSISISDRSKKAGYESKGDLHDSSTSFPDRGKKNNETKAEKENKNEGEKKPGTDGDRKKDESPVTVVLKLNLHCEGCVKKFKRIIRRYKGVENVDVDLFSDKLTVTGKVDPAWLQKQVKYDTKRMVELISLQPQEDGCAHTGEKKSEEKSDEKPEEEKEDKKPKEKVVIKMVILDDRQKEKTMKAVSSLPGIDSVAMDLKEMKVTIVGDFDPIHAVSKLRNIFPEETITMGPAKEQETNENKIEVDKSKRDQRKVYERKNVQSEVDERKSVSSEVDEGRSAQSEPVAELVNLYKNYYPYHN